MYYLIFLQNLFSIFYRLCFKLKDYVKHKLGYLGVFVMGLAGSSVPIWPLPGSWAAFLAGGAGLNPALIGLAAGIGEPLGESTYYMAGYGGQAAVTNVKGYREIVRWMERHGAITLFLVCAIPNFLPVIKPAKRENRPGPVIKINHCK